MKRFKIVFQMNDKMRERMAAGLSFLYTTRDGREWYIDAQLSFPFRQIDLAECGYDAMSLDGRDLEFGFPSLSVCQMALEENCPQWRGEGWYWIGNGEDVEPIWFDSIDELRERVVAIRGRFDVYGETWTVEYRGDGAEPLPLK